MKTLQKIRKYPWVFGGLAGLSLWAAGSYAQRPAHCPALEGQLGGVSYSTPFNQARQSCGVRVSVQYPGEAEARQFQFYDDGALFSFAPVEGGHFVTAGGYLFPRLAQGGVRVEELGDVVVGLPSGARVVFSSQTSQLIEHPLQTLANGARIYPQGLFLDLGVREPGPRGNTLPHAGRPEGLALFVDPQGVRCELSNREVFDYSTESPRFKLSDAELKNYLEIRCPGLDRRAL